MRCFVDGIGRRPRPSGVTSFTYFGASGTGARAARWQLRALFGTASAETATVVAKFRREPATGAHADPALILARRRSAHLVRRSRSLSRPTEFVGAGMPVMLGRTS